MLNVKKIALPALAILLFGLSAFGQAAGGVVQVNIQQAGGTAISGGGALPVGGAVASGTADSGNPVKTGCVYNSSPVTVSGGQRVDSQCDVNGYLKIDVAASPLDTAVGASVTENPVYTGGINETTRTTIANGQKGSMHFSTDQLLLTATLGVDPCASSGVAKSSAVINVTSATTTSLVPVSGSTTIYVCGFSVTISEVVTTANTIQFEYGTGATCTSPTALTGLYGAGGVTAGIPITVAYGGGGSTIFKTPASNGLCALTAIGASGTFQGVVTYVQQ